ncbi:YceI family protein [Flavobacterium franklandianum]|uniref:YceI family protein n=1 Tax=Flavobacterium franklandianum TaxID=2594430 RepID=A0A553CRF6_9FLAO|nr:YceI family protein [Flavobacterium franklandianum]TRX23041.1 YceI family protein [Flavobacterium franklandianum]
MKKIISILLFLLVHNSFAQKEMTTANGVIHFEASVPLYEEVTATNKTISSKLNIGTGALTSVVPMKEFRFKLSLMEEHFNEKYLETDHYPQATFKGKIEGFNLNIIDSNPKEFKLKGELKIHGKIKKIYTIVALKKIENKLEIVSNFNVNIKDYNIKIPEILSMKIAETVTIRTVFWVQ